MNNVINIDRNKIYYYCNIITTYYYCNIIYNIKQKYMCMSVCLKNSSKMVIGSDLKFAHVILNAIRRSTALLSIFNFYLFLNCAPALNSRDTESKEHCAPGMVQRLRLRLSRWRHGFESHCGISVLLNHFTKANVRLHLKDVNNNGMNKINYNEYKMNLNV